MSREARAELIEHLQRHSVRTDGPYQLKSGRMSPWFLALELIPDDVTAIGGLTVGADPVAYGIAAVAATRGRDLRSFTIRKEAKDHGVAGRMAGALQPGDRVVVTEDAVTRGTSPMEAVDAIRQFGAEPVLIMPIVDRGGTCAAMAAAAGVAFHPLVTAPDLGFPYEKDVAPLTR
jgi:orotate phosphoribosyltransferase